MATQFLINNVSLGTQAHYAGEQLDSVTDAVAIAALLSVGGQVFDSTPALVTAAAQAASIRLRGGDPTTMAEIMDGALDQNQQTTGAAAVPKASVQTGSTVLVAGTKTIATANITATSVVMAFPAGLAGGTPGSLTTGTKVVGAPGSFIITSSNVLDTSTVTWLVIG